MFEKIAKLLTRNPKLIVIIAVLLLIPSALGVIGTKVNYDILEYLPKDLDSVNGQVILNNTFHNAASSMLVIEDMPAKDVEKLTAQINDVEGVSKAVWVSDVIDISVPPEILPEKLKDAFYGDNESTMILVQYENSSSSKETMDAIDNVRALLNKQCFLSGMSVIVKDTKELADKEMPIYVGLAVLLSLITMFCCMESWLLPPIFLLGIFFAVAYNFGTNIFLGEISYITKSIAAILQLGVTMDYSIFLINRYDEEKLKFSDRGDAMAVAIKSTFVSLLGSSLTTIAGFMALCFMQLTLGFDIGIVMIKGVVFGVLTVVTVLPSLILLLDRQIHQYVHKSLLPNFTRFNNYIMKNARKIAVIFILLFVPMFLAQSNINVYYNLDESLPRDLDSIVALNKLKDDFNMASTHFVIIRDDIPAYKVKEMIDKMEKVPGVEKVIAYDEVIGPAIPDSFIPNEVKGVCKKDGLQFIMINSRYKAALDEANEQIDRLSEIVKKYDKKAMITGEVPLTKDLINVADVDFKVTSYVSILSIFIIIAFCFKSISIPFLLVAIIEFAIFINVGIPFFTGTVIPFISPTIIGCVQLGATVDYAILMTTRYQEELRNGYDKHEAIKIAANSSDRAILTSSLVFFCATFGVSMISQIEMIQSICSMLARGALISAATIMCILSVVLLITEKVIDKTTYRWKTNPQEIAASQYNEKQEAAL